MSSTAPVGGRPTTPSILSTEVDPELMAAVRATVYHLQRLIGPEVTIKAFVGEALFDAVRRAQKLHNGGRPFPDQPGRLPPGPRPRLLGDSAESLSDSGPP